MSRVADGTNYLKVDIGTTFWPLVANDYISITFWYHKNSESTWSNFDTWLAVHQDSTDGNQIYVDQKSNPSNRMFANTAGNDENIELGGSDILESDWNFFHGYVRYDGADMGAHVNLGTYEFNAIDIGGWTNDYVRYLNVFTKAAGTAIQTKHKISCIALWDVKLSTQMLSALYNDKDNPRTVHETYGGLRCLFLDENLYSGGTEEYTCPLTGYSLVEQVSSTSYDAGEPGISAYGGGGGDTRTYAPLVGIQSGNEGFNGLIR